MLFGLGLVAGIAFLVTGLIWLAGLAAVLLVPGILLLYQAGKSLS